MSPLHFLFLALHESQDRVTFCRFTLLRPGEAVDGVSEAYRWELWLLGVHDIVVIA